MKKFIKILATIVGLILVYCLISLIIFDSKCHNEQSIFINAPKEKVWNNVSSMKAINSWNPWMKYDPNLTITYKGNSGEIGDGFHWKGNKDVGEGEEEITAVIPYEKVSTKMHFIEPMDDTATSDVILETENSGTKVTWTIDYEIEAYFKPMKPMMNYQMNKSFSEGLGKLKEISEK